MLTAQKQFIELALRCNVLQWGEFTLKSGRMSPYFFNAGLFYDNHALRELGLLYAQCMIDHAVHVEHLFGPAYKGIPLATATASALDELGQSVTVTFNRKEAKDHGEQGLLIGAPLSGPTAMIDDVITAGTAFREAQRCIQAHGGQLTHVIIALDRCERGLDKLSALSEIKQQGIQVHALITLFDLMHYLEEVGHHAQLQALHAYHIRYGA
jgi:orotate phosphoribosyltransferase